MLPITLRSNNRHDLLMIREYCDLANTKCLIKSLAESNQRLKVLHDFACLPVILDRR